MDNENKENNGPGLPDLAGDNQRTNVNFEYKPQKKNSKKKPVLIILGIIALAAVVFLLIDRRNIKQAAINLYQTPGPSPVVSTPTPSPGPVLNRADWSFEVLNGSGESGLARKIAGQLKELGYQVVKTGNADKNNYPKTQISVKKEQTDQAELVIADLKDTIEVASIAGELTEGTASARIILGKDSSLP